MIKTPLMEYMDNHGGLKPWSYTKLNMAKCPFQANMTIDRGFGKEFKTDLVSGMEYLECGIAIHKLIENWHLYNNLMVDIDDPGIVLSKRNIPMHEWVCLMDEYEKAKNVFYYFTDGKPGFSGGEIVGVEEVIQIDHDGNVVEWEARKPYATSEVNGVELIDKDETEHPGYLKGTLDLIQKDGEEVTITDYKRQYNVISKSDLNKNFQMMLYSYLVLCKYPDVKTVNVRLYFTRYGYTQEISRESSEIMKVKSIVDQMIIGLNDNLYVHALNPEPIPGDHCKLCRFITLCPISDDREIISRIKTDEDAKRVASELELRKERVRRSSDRLKDWTSAFGPVTTYDGSLQYGYVPNHTESWEVTDIDGLLKMMLVEQVSIKEILSPDSRKLNSFLRKLKKDNSELFNKMLGTVTRKKLSTSFRGRKVK